MALTYKNPTFKAAGAALEMDGTVQDVTITAASAGDFLRVVFSPGFANGPVTLKTNTSAVTDTDGDDYIIDPKNGLEQYVGLTATHTHIGFLGYEGTNFSYAIVT